MLKVNITRCKFGWPKIRIITSKFNHTDANNVLRPYLARQPTFFKRAILTTFLGVSRHFQLTFTVGQSFTGGVEKSPSKYQVQNPTKMV